MSATEANPKPSRAGRLLTLVRQLIDYGRQLATRLRSSPQPPGAGDIALILLRITRGLLRAEALEARIIRGAAQLDAERGRPRPRSDRQPPPAQDATRPAEAAPPAVAPGPALDPGISLPTPEQIAAEVRRRPIGAVLADICRDLGILPCNPLWRELSALIIRHGGNLANLVKDILDRPFPPPELAWTPASPLSPAPSGAGPP